MTRSLVSMGLDWVLKRPAVAEAAFSALVSRREVIATSESVLALSHQAVVDVLSRPDDFLIGPILRPRVVSGDFLLTKDDHHPHATERRALSEGLYQKDFFQSVTNRTQAAADDVVAQAAGRRIDIVSELAAPVLGAVMRDCIIGVPSAHIAQIFDAGIALGIRAGNSSLDQETLKTVNEASKSLEAHIRQSLRLQSPENLVSRLKHRGLDDSSIVASTCGLALTSMITVAKAFAHTVAQLVARPEVRMQAKEAASYEQNDLLLPLIYECLRLHPTVHFVQRYAPFATSIRTSSSGEHKVAPGTQINVGLCTAMLDESAFPNPRQFRLDRPTSHVLAFGTGMHDCFGRPLAEMQLCVLVRAFLVLADQVDWDASKSVGIEYRWPSAKSYRLSLKS